MHGVHISLYPILWTALRSLVYCKFPTFNIVHAIKFETNILPKEKKISNWIQALENVCCPEEKGEYTED